MKMSFLNITQLQYFTEKYRVETQSSIFMDFADNSYRRENSTPGSFKPTREGLLTQRHEVITAVQHHVLVQSLLFRPQVSPLVRREDHSHISKLH